MGGISHISTPHQIIWSGMMSIAVASFGANAQAAALKQ